MKLSLEGIRAKATGLVAGAFAAFWGLHAAAEELLGQPTPGAIGLQRGASPLREDAEFFHNIILMPIITAISVLVLFLLLWCVVRYNKRSNPTPARWSHNTFIEVIWTLVPVLILMFIAIFSFRLLFDYHDTPKPDVIVKATGYQWYWGYEYPDQKIAEYISNGLSEEDAAAKKVPYLLAASEPIVVPVNKTVKVLVTGADVIHAFGVPAFGVITDAVPGRVNEVWFKPDKTGIFYGNCRELCGVDHAYMPIEVHVVTQPEFDAWVAKKAPAKAAVTPTTLNAVADAASAAAQPAAATAPAAPAPAAAAPAAAPAAK